MLVVLDAQPLMSDPLQRKLEWRILSRARQRWDVQVVVLESSLVEVVAGIDRSIRSAHDTLHSASDKVPRWLESDVSDQLAKIQERRVGMEGEVRARLASMGVEIEPTADVPHLELVRRAAHRKRPCNKDGDGYRDTLMWLTVLQLARGRDDEVVLVTDNYTDFAASPKERDTLHPQLITELREAGLEGRVQIATTVSDLTLALAKEHSLDGDLPDIDKHLVTETITDYLHSTLYAGLPGRSVDAARAGLPLEAQHGAMRSWEPTDGPTTEITAIGDGQAVATFTETIACVIELDVPWPRGSYDPEIGPETEDPELFARDLVITGLVQLDENGAPLEGEIQSFAAPAGDDYAAAHAALAAQRTAVRTSGSVLDPALLARLSEAMQTRVTAEDFERRRNAGAAFKDKIAQRAAFQNAVGALEKFDTPATRAHISQVRSLLSRVDPKVLKIAAEAAAKANEQQRLIDRSPTGQAWRARTAPPSSDPPSSDPPSSDPPSSD